MLYCVFHLISTIGFEQEQTGFSLNIREKKHRFLHDIVQAASSRTQEVAGCPPALQLPGNCIPCALWHLLPAKRVQIEEHLGNAAHASNVLASRRGYRTLSETEIV